MKSGRFFEISLPPLDAGPQHELARLVGISLPTYLCCENGLARQGKAGPRVRMDCFDSLGLVLCFASKIVATRNTQDEEYKMKSRMPDMNRMLNVRGVK